MTDGPPDTLTRFLDGVRRHPDRPAVLTPTGGLTFAGLHERVEALAAALRRAGAGPGTVTGVALPRCPDLVAAPLAVWRTGSAFTLLDPTHPGPRLRALAEGAGTTVVVAAGGHDWGPGVTRLDPQAAGGGQAEAAQAQGGQAQGGQAEGAQAQGGQAQDGQAQGRQAEGAQAQDAQAQGGQAQSAQAPPGRGSLPECAVPRDAIAYVVHTSGSAGRPKPVLVSHANVAHLVGALESAGCHPAAPGRVAWLAGLSFDASVQQWLRVCRGDTLVLPDERTRQDPRRLAAFLRAARVTDLDATPSLWALLRPHLVRRAPGELPLRLYLGGEPVPPAMWEDLVTPAADGSVTALNLYGPAECTIDATAAPVTGPAPVIGGPLPGVRAHLLDRRLRPVPDGESGELYLAGGQVALGYAGLPALTAARYVAEPGGPAGSRMYRTGDRARRSASGALVYEGRVDDQFKLHGVRIEPGEIEAVLTGHPAVARAVVVLREDRPGDRRVVAYVTARADAEPPGPAELRAHCARLLPPVLVPSAVVVLDAFTPAPGGKVDRSALPAPDYARAGRGGTPNGARERRLCLLYADVLGVPRVGPRDDFFELGGHSLLAMRLIGRIRAALGTEAEVRDLFAAPTPAALAERLGAAAPSRRPVLRRLARPARLPLSYAQRRLWFLDRLHGPGASYNEHIALRFEGPLDRPALRAALHDVVVRHEVLRTVFPDEGGEPYQHVLGPAGSRPDLPLSTVTEDGLADALRHAADVPFDLSRQAPLRAALFRPAPGTHVLLLVTHHIASDGWSLGPLARDLALAYRARHAGRAPDRPELPVQYADYTLWQRALLGDPDAPDSLHSRQLAHWRKELDGLPERLPLPGERAARDRRAGGQDASGRGGTVPFTCDAELHRALLELAREHRCTLFMVVRAGLAVLLTRLGAGHDIPLGVASAGRGDPALDDLVGFFVNTLLLRTDTRGNPTFRALLEQVRETGLAAAEHQDLPFDRLVEDLNPRRAGHDQPLFQVMLAFQNTAHADWDFGAGLTVTPHAVERDRARFDLALSVTELHTADGAPGGLRGELEYSLDLFEAASAHRLAARLTAALRTAASDPDRRIDHYDLLTEEERHRPPATAAPALPEPRAALDLFEERALRAPDAVAVCFEGQRVSYGELDARAGRLAHRLAARGTGPDDVVAAVLDRSVELIVAVLAAWKTGAAFLPVDPRYPAARIAHILTDARPALLLTAARTTPPDEASAASVPRLDVLDAEREDPARPATGPDPARRPCPDPERRPRPDHLAYVIYTSGSTGTPKPVAVTRAGYANLVAHQAATLNVGPESRVLQFASAGFDAFFWEVGMALTAGAALVLAPAARLLPGPDLARLADEHAISHLTVPPAVLGALPPDALPGVTTVVVAGEACGAELAARWSRGRVLRNGYGPSETTVCATMSEPLRGDGTVPPIGDPVRGTRVHVLDELLRPVPTGVTGELYVAGAGLARGYRGRPGRTAERFVADPYGPPGTRAYRTGDLARRTSDGRLEFVGRADDQVKLRGHRIELGEVEAHVAAADGVAQAAVVLREDRLGEPAIVAYVVPEAPPGPADGGESGRVEDWRRLHEAVYTAPGAADPGEDDFTGWHDSRDGTPIPVEDMREWRDATVRRIRELRPARVLEIGVGSGLLLTELAPHTAEYWGLDFSAGAIRRLRPRVDRLGLPDGRVVLRRQTAHDATGIPAGHFDVVVLNSVAQYFPSGGYLARVLDAAGRALAPGGRVFVGDVRNLRLRDRARPADDGGARDVPELLVDPDYFAAYAAGSGRFTTCDVRLKRGERINELTALRYDAVLGTGPAPDDPAPGLVLRWGADARTPDTVAGIARTRRPARFTVTGVPNARVTGYLPGPARSRRAGADPEHLARLGEELGYAVALRWPADGDDTRFDAEFTAGGVIPDRPVRHPGHRDLARYVSAPRTAADEHRVRAAVRRRVAAFLPDFMMPSAVVVLDRLPLGPHGKTDRAALPAPPTARPDGPTAPRRPRTDREKALCAMYAELLGLDEVGTDESFFDLGGHSLLATRLVSRIRADLGIDVPVGTLFDAPRVADLAPRLDGARTSRPPLRRMRPTE
ncbi:amino acid adenylation domain-containing protein [Streptomyces sp. SID8366]|uniref:non-ribosomal peptide synthetase n=3 Tax=Streptomyces TaxID=1883 RepID=UPI000DC2EE7A|nr:MULTISPECIES: non-ribosomal peptide synthetase [unclassified Streptomyces]MYU07840.1 amino acid adenylation domain-containing protein [Streptomyces sp. SID8366]RAJ52181.1 pristinamycin I synthase-3/4 [Streptomyces sp. PsTaAH-130]